MRYVIVIVVILILFGVYRIVRRSKSADTTRPAERQQSIAPADTTFHAVSIKSAPGACEAAKAMQGRRFLSTAAPRLPLSDCDVLECKCRFSHHKDRRTGDERRDTFNRTFGGINVGEQSEDHRKRGERRDDSSDDIF